MNIDQSRELLYDYARGRLSEQERSSLEQQLQSSEDLRSELEKVKRYYAAIDDADPVPVPDNFLEKVYQRIESGGKRSLLDRLLFPLHLKLPIEFAGVVATVVLVVFIFIPQLDKKNYSDFEPVAIDNVQQEAASPQDATAGKPVSGVSATTITAETERTISAKKEVSADQEVKSVAPSKPRPKLSVPKAQQSSPMASVGVREVDNKVSSFEKRRMKSRSVNAEYSDTKEMAAVEDVKTGEVHEAIPVLLKKYTLKWTVMESREGVVFYSASGTPSAVTLFLRESAKRPNITVIKVIPENYSAALDSVVVEFSVKDNAE